MGKKGSALVVAVLLIAVVGGAAFAVGRLFFVESNLAGWYENSIVAYYAAESGIEEGLLRYRYDKNQELPLNGGVYSSNRVNRSNISTKSLSTNVLKTDAVSPPTDRYYDLNISYLNYYYGTDTNGDNWISPTIDMTSPSYDNIFTIPKDESVKIDISQIIKTSGLDFNIYVIYPAGASDCRIEAKIISSTKSGSSGPGLGLNEIKVLYKTGAANSSLGEIQLTNAGSYYFQVGILSAMRGTTSGITFDPQTDKAELFLKPINSATNSCNSSAKIALQVTPLNNRSISSPWNSIKSTGYFGGVTRTLEAKVDRQAGTLYDLYDFVVLDYQ